jgi:diguanylate cyclase (GGDEF)-like protein
VILVGRTGLDAALRLDEAFELARVRTPHDAMGELANPLDEQTPAATVVVVGAEIESDLLDPPPLATSDGTPIPGRERLVEFIRALRLVNPAVRVLGVETDRRDDRPPRTAHDLFDGLVHSANASEDIRSAFARPSHTPPRPQEPSLRPAIPSAPALQAFTPTLIEAPANEVQAASGLGNPAPLPPPDETPAILDQCTGDEALVEVAVRGQDLTPMALRVLRNRVGDAGLAFVPPPASKAGGAPQGVPVVWSDVVLGYLIPSKPGGPDLASHAKWLAGWMRLRDQQEQLRHAAFTDPLTSAWNRRYLDRFLAGAIESAREQRWSVTVLMFDIDDFKKYNDEYGHDAGDEILSEVVRLLRAVTRPTDKVCRVGGDEFAVVFHEPEGPRSPDSKHPTTVSAITQRFQQQVTGHKFPKLSGCAPGTLTISGGLATFPWDGQSPAQLLARADERAMESKRQGKNAITIGPGAVLKML